MATTRSRRSNPKYNENFFRGMGGPGPTAVGILAIVLIIIGLYLAFTKSLPWSSPGYEVKATFANAVEIANKSPVRIAGVNVGKVTGVSRDGNNAVVTFTVDGSGQPVHSDASAQIRPRIFLEGNFFVDLDPGSPSAPDLPDNGSIPITRTSTAVQLDQVLTSLQQPERQNLQQTLQGLGLALTYQPTAADDATQSPAVQGLSAAAALNKTFDYGATAGKTSAIVNEALLGTKPHDLSGLLLGLNRVSQALVGHEADLQGLISNFNTFTGALAAQSDNLSTTIQLLPGTLNIAKRSLISLNAALPPLRGFAIALRPGVAETPAVIKAGLPWLAQAKPLLSQAELGGIAKLLARGIPPLNVATTQTLALLPKLTNFNRCVSHNLVPAGNTVLDDRFGAHNFSSGKPNSHEFFYSTVGLSGETANYDGNGSYVRFQPGGGPVPVKTPNPGGIATKFIQAGTMFGNTIAPPLGTRPALHGTPPIKTSVPCYKTPAPNLNGPAAAAGGPSPHKY